MGIFGKVLTVISLIVVVAVLAALPTMLLWNWLMPDMFGLAEVGFWEALGLNILGGILFRGASVSSKS